MWATCTHILTAMLCAQVRTYLRNKNRSYFFSFSSLQKCLYGFIHWPFAFSTQWFQPQWALCTHFDDDIDFFDQLTQNSETRIPFLTTSKPKRTQLFTFSMQLRFFVIWLFSPFFIRPEFWSDANKSTPMKCEMIRRRKARRRRRSSNSSAERHYAKYYVPYRTVEVDQARGTEQMIDGLLNFLWMSDFVGFASFPHFFFNNNKK